MDRFSILSVLVGSLIIVFRAPMIFAPVATIRFFKRPLSADSRVRRVGIEMAPLAAALRALPAGEATVVGSWRRLPEVGHDLL